MQALWSRALFEAHRVQADTTTSTADSVEQLHAAIVAMREQSTRLQLREAAVDAHLRELDERLSRLAAIEAAISRRAASTTATRKSARLIRQPTTRGVQKKRAPRRPTVRKSTKAKRR